jgi:hypothetical protein
VRFFALVSDEIQAVVDFYPSREEAEAELRDALLRRAWVDGRAAGGAVRVRD